MCGELYLTMRLLDGWGDSPKWSSNLFVQWPVLPTYVHRKW